MVGFWGNIDLKPFPYRKHVPSPSSSASSDAGCQSMGCEFESQLGQHSFRSKTKINATSVIRLQTIGKVYAEKQTRS